MTKYQKELTAYPVKEKLSSTMYAENALFYPHLIYERGSK